MRLPSLFLLFLCLTLYLPHITADDKKLEATEKEIDQLMKTLKGDRFSTTTGTTLSQLTTTTKGIPQFVARLFHGIWYIHQNQFQHAHDVFQQIIKDKQTPSKSTTRAVELLIELMIRIMELSQSTTIDPIAERECQSVARRLMIVDEPLTKNYEKITWMWENLIHAEATWLLQNLPDHNNPGNKKCVYVPGLLAQEWYDNKQFRAAELLEQKYGEIMEELTPFLKRYESTLFHDVGGNTAETDKNLVLQGKWQDISLWSAGQKNNDVCKSLPKLCHLLESEIPEVTRNVQGHALLSRLSAGTIVNRHHGYSNNQLTLHLGLIVPSKTAHPDYDIDLGIEVNNIHGTWTQGKVIVFDDSFYHSVWYKYNKKGEKPKTTTDDDPDRPGDRLVLLLRGYHPEYTLEERAHLVMTHAETPWTIEQRVAEHKRLLTDKNVRARWEEDKKKFLSVYQKEEKKQEKKKHAHDDEL